MTDLETRPLRVVPPPSNGNGHTNGKHPPGRVPPHDLGAERDLLGAILLSPRALDATLGILQPEDFYRPAHTHIYTACLELASAGEPIDARTVTDRLARTGLGDHTGGIEQMTQLIAETTSTRNADRYAHIVRDHATRRRLIAAAAEISELGYHAGGDLDTILDQAEQMLYRIGDTAVTIHAELLSDAVQQWLDTLEQRRSDTRTAVNTGLADLDEKLSGYRPGQLITACGRPGSGKSLFGVQCGYHVADTKRQPVLIVSAEMPIEELVDRIIASNASVDNQRIRSGNLDENSDWARISGAVSRLYGVPLYLYDAPNATLAAIRAETRRVTAKAGPLALIVVDYLQLLTTAARSENRQVEVAELSRGLKRLARDLRVPVLALAQVNRNLENRADKRPTLADLRESGAIEADSDVVIGVYRDEMYRHDSPDRGTAELIVLKQRAGPTGTVQVAYLAHYGRFANMARV